MLLQPAFTHAAHMRPTLPYEHGAHVIHESGNAGVAKHNNTNVTTVSISMSEGSRNCDRYDRHQIQIATNCQTL